LAFSGFVGVDGLVKVKAPDEAGGAIEGSKGDDVAWAGDLVAGIAVDGVGGIVATVEGEEGFVGVGGEIPTWHDVLSRCEAAREMG